MDDLEKRLIRLEEGMARMESAIERMAGAVETLIEVRVHGNNTSNEVAKLREASHQHGNKIQEIPQLREKIKEISTTTKDIDNRVKTLEVSEPTHKQSDTLIGKLTWTAIGISIAVMLHKAGLF